jgi:hypothetical protein
MKMIALLAAAAAATLAIPAASAAPVSAGTPMVTHSASVVALDQRHHGRKSYWRKTCTTKWRNHHRQRVCRKVRAWR